ncbi:MAG TPA: SRPBCC family protein [Candidatus Saccharimonadales bacterium]|nr:SRPBCC family protein [Candidatus Saccharimonadales bacterium]
MIKAENMVVINRSADTIFSFLSHGENAPKWRSNVLEVTLLSGTSGQKNAVYEQVLRGPLGIEIKLPYRIVNLDPPMILTLSDRSTQPRLQANYHLKNMGSTTELTYSLQYNAAGWRKLFSSLMKRELNNEVANLSDLKHYLEKKRT